MMKEIKFLFLLTVFWVPHISSLPKLHGGGCTLLGDSVYYVGGKDMETDQYNSEIYKLDLSDPFKLDGNSEAPWKALYLTNSSIPKSYKGSVVGVDLNKVYLFGGESLEMDKSVWYFDVESLAWNIDLHAGNKIGNLFLNNFNKKKESDKKDKQKETNLKFDTALVNTYLLKDEANEVLYYFGGTLKANNGTSIPNDILFTYNLKERTISDVIMDFSPNLDGTSNLINDTIINFGGSRSNTLASLNEFQIFTLVNRDQPPVYKIAGSILPNMSNPSSVLVDDAIYTMGGLKENTDLLYKTPTGKLEWNLVNINGLMNTERGCLVHYKGHLIYSFGMKDNVVSTKTQIINLEKNVTTNSLQLDAAGNNLPSIIGGSVGGIIIFLMILGGGFYYYYKKYLKVQEDILKPPEYLNGMIWAGSTSFKPDIDASIDFYATQLTEFDDDLSQPEKAAMVIAQNSPYLKDHRLT